MSENIYKDLIDKVEAGKKVVMVTKVNNSSFENKFSEEKCILTEEYLHQQKYISTLDENILEKSILALETGNIQFIKTSENEAYLIEPYFPEPQLIVFGGGHIAKPLVEFGKKVGFKLTVIDDRPSFANTERFPEADKVLCERFEKSFDFINFNKSTFVVIVTRGHRHDIDCLREVLKYEIGYVGMIGSKRRVKGVMDQLISEGYSKEVLAKVNSPIGIEIGAVTPEEIAISIIAEVIKYRRLSGKKTEGNIPTKVNWPEFDKEVLNELSKEENCTKAIVTITSSKGSVPRKAGAKMVVWPHGKIVGSIGGGCSEGEVIIKAYEAIRSGRYHIENVDMTNEVVEEAGMVCGGTMEVLIEVFKK